MTADSDRRDRSLFGPFLLSGLLAGALYWIFDSAVMAFVFDEGDFAGLIFNSDTDDVWMRSFTVLVFVAAGASLDVIRGRERRARSGAVNLGRILENSRNEIYIFNAETLKFDLVNRGARENLGYTMPELRELTPLDIKPEYTRESFAELTEPLKSGEKAKVEFRTVHRRKDGSTYPVEVHLQSTLYEGEPGFVAIILDLTRAEKAEAERRALDEKVRHSQKLESLGVLAGGIAHDFNNLLVGILGNADLALHEMSETTPGRPYIADIVAASQRAAALCKQMLAYSGKGRFVIKAVNLSDVVEDMGHLLQVAIPKKVVLKYDLEPNLPAVEVDVAQLQQVIMNLITNAAEAIGDRSGIVTIATGAMECDRDYLRETYLDEELPEGSYVYVEVSDTGEGMNQETKAKLFDPFFTTKFAGRGLGLAAVLGVVRGHRGAIKVYSELGRGTTIKFLLPASNEPAEGIAPDAPPSDDWQGSGTVLVIDDEETIRVLARRILESAGFAVLTAADGLEGVATYAEHADDLTAVLLDMTMPKMGGEEAFREMHRIRSDVPVILSSGYNEQEAISRFAGKGLAGFIQKPYRVSQLIAEFRRVLAPEARPDDQAQ